MGDTSAVATGGVKPFQKLCGECKIEQWLKWKGFTPSDFDYDFENDKLAVHHVTFNEAVSKKRTRRQLTEKEIDAIVESQVDDDSAWEEAVTVRRARPASLSIPAELAARAAFLAKLHRENNVEEWLTKVIKERVELEEVAFNEAKKEMSLRNGV